MYTAKFETFLFDQIFLKKVGRVLIEQISLMKSSESKFKIATREKNKTTNE